MMARLLVKSPLSLRSGEIDGSSGVDQALRMKSIEVTGSERVQSNDVTVDDRGLIYLLDRVRGLHILERIG